MAAKRDLRYRLECFRVWLPMKTQTFRSAVKSALSSLRSRYPEGEVTIKMHRQRWERYAGIPGGPCNSMQARLTACISVTLRGLSMTGATISLGDDNRPIFWN